MKEMSKIESAVYLTGGALMVIGVGCFVFMWQQRVVSWIFLAGAVLFSTIQAMQTYEGNDITIKRLKRIQSLADILFVVAGILMVDTAWNFMMGLFQNYITYITYLYNKWVIPLLIAAILEMYTTHRLSSELKKTKNT